MPSLLALRDERHPASVRALSLTPCPPWPAGALLTALALDIASLEPRPALVGPDRADRAIVTDQGEYLSLSQGAVLLGTLRDLQLRSLAAPCQPVLAPPALHWPAD